MVLKNFYLNYKLNKMETRNKSILVQGIYTYEEMSKDCLDGFTFAVFKNYDEVEDFIWDYCFNNRKEYFNPYELADGGIFIEYQK